MPAPVKPKLPVEPNISALNAILARIVERAPTGNEDAPAAKHYRNITDHAADVFDATSALQELHSKRDPNETDAAHFKRVSSSAAKLLHSIDLIDSKVKGAWAQANADVANRIATKLRLKQDGYATEVRAVFRSMSHKERLDLLAELTASTEHGPTLAAILEAPRWLTGMPDDMRKNFRDAYEARHAAAEIEEDNLIEDAYDHAMAALNTAREVVNSYTDERKLLDITRREAEAVEARAAFAVSVQP